jgi:hypothetical protein
MIFYEKTQNFTVSEKADFQVLETLRENVLESGVLLRGICPFSDTFIIRQQFSV